MMPTVDLIISGISLMLLGMGVVFSFLICLVLSMLGMSRLALLAERQGGTVDVRKPASPVIHTAAGARPELMAVISAAVSHYRATHT